MFLDGTSGLNGEAFLRRRDIHHPSDGSRETVTEATNSSTTAAAPAAAAASKNSHEEHDAARPHVHGESIKLF